MAGLLLVGTAAGLAVYHEAAGSLERGVVHFAGRAVRAIVAVDAETLLVAVDGLGAQESFDGGAHWLPAAGPPPEPVGLRVSSLAGPVALANPRLQGATAYARLAGRSATLVGAGAGGMMIFLSPDDGIHWAPAALRDPPVGPVTTLAPDASRSGAAWAGSAGGSLLFSDDGGQSWRELAREPAAIYCLTSVKT